MRACGENRRLPSTIPSGPRRGRGCGRNGGADAIPRRSRRRGEEPGIAAHRDDRPRASNHGGGKARSDTTAAAWPARAQSTHAADKERQPVLSRPQRTSVVRRRESLTRISLLSSFALPNRPPPSTLPPRHCCPRLRTSSTTALPLTPYTIGLLFRTHCSSSHSTSSTAPPHPHRAHSPPHRPTSSRKRGLGTTTPVGSHCASTSTGGVEHRRISRIRTGRWITPSGRRELVTELTGFAAQRHLARPEHRQASSGPWVRGG